jgi:hypothetical protein
MMNSISQLGGIPGSSYGKTSGNSRTILISFRDVPFTWLSTLICLAEIAAMNYIVVPSSQVKQIAFLAHKITPSYFLNQSMPRIISMPSESMMMRFDKKSTPLMAILIAGHSCLVFISPLSELTIMVYFMMVMGRLCLQQILMI